MELEREMAKKKGGEVSHKVEGMYGLGVGRHRDDFARAQAKLIDRLLGQDPEQRLVCIHVLHHKAHNIYMDVMVVVMVVWCSK